MSPGTEPREPVSPARQPGPDVPSPTGGASFRGARSELRRQLREQKRVRTMAMVTVVVMLLGAPMLYFGILFATRDPVLNSLDRLGVPSWAAQSPEDRIISGSRWCFIDCRLRERTLVSLGEPAETTETYQDALRAAGWVRWEVRDCPQVEVDGDYSCWTRDEYTLDLWVRPPECAYDPLNLRPEVTDEDEDEEESEPDGDETGDETDGDTNGGAPEECSGAVVQIKMQNRVADERGLPEPGEAPTDTPADQSDESDDESDDDESDDDDDDEAGEDTGEETDES